MRRYNRLLGILLTLTMLFSSISTVAAAPGDEFDLINSNNGMLIADQDTKYITLFTQDESTGLITATIQVQSNRTKDAASLMPQGFWTQISFDERVSPCTVVGATPYKGGLMSDKTAFMNYFNGSVDNLLLSIQYIRNDDDGRFIGALAVQSGSSKPVTISPGETVDIAKYYFMPNNAGEKLDMNMFGYEVIEIDRFNMIVTSLANGNAFLSAADPKVPLSDVKIYPEAFKIHVQHPEPAVSADNVDRIVTGYDPDTMEWSASEDGPYVSTTPVIGDAEETIYVRVKGDDAYSGTDKEYVNYKKYVASNPVELLFDDIAQSQKPEIDPVTEGDDTVSGTGEPGAEIEVTFPGGETETTTVDDDGNWVVDVPDDETLEAGEEIIVVQTEPGLLPSDEETAIVQARPDAAAVIEKIANNNTSMDGKTRVGDELEYTITVKNTGDPKSLLVDAVVTDVLPNGVTYVTDSTEIDGINAGSAASYDDTDRTLTVTLGEVPGDTQKTITFNVTVNADAYGLNIRNAATVNAKDDSDDEEIEEETEEPDDRVVENPTEIYASKSSENTSSEDDKTRVGDTILYTITVGNGNEDSLLKDVTVDDALPNYVTFTPDSVEINGNPANASEYDYDEVSRTLSISLGDIAGGEEFVITFEVTIDDDAYGQTIQNSATVSGIDEDITDPKEIEVEEEEVKSALDIEKTAENNTSMDGKTRVGDELEYTITVKNTSKPGALLVDTVVTDVLPNGVTYVTGSTEIDGINAGSAASYDDTDRTLIVTLGEVPGDTQKTITFRVTVDADAYGLNIRNAATVNAKDDCDDEEVEETTEEPDDRIVDDPHNIFASKSSKNLYSPDDKTRVGDTLEYTITVKNDGNVDVVWTEMQITDELPADVTFVADSVKINGVPADELEYTYDEDSRTITVDLGEIAGGEECVVTFEATVNDDAYGRQIKNSAMVTGRDGDDEEIEEEVEEPGGGRVVDNPTEIYATKSSENPSSEDGKTRVGDTILYTITVGNSNTESLLRDVTVDDALPNYVTFTPGSVMINGNPADASEYSYDAASRTLSVSFGDIAGGEEYVVTFEVTIDDDAYGQTIQNSATVSGIEEDITDPKEIEVEEEEGNSVIVSFNANGGTAVADKTVIVGEAYGTLSTTTRSGYTFAGWYTAATGGTTVTSSTIVTNDRDHTLFARWTNPGGGTGGGGGGGGGTTTTPAVVELPETETPLGALELDKENHFAYISGYPDSSVRPDNQITRAETAMIFYNLLLNKNMGSNASAFNDVADGAWYAQAVNYLASVGILSGYPDGSFKPNQIITRAEFATIAAKFDKLESTGNNAFPDVGDDHWAVSYINSAAVKGWVKGYPDGSFKADMDITRAEVVTVVNTMLGRKIKPENIPSGIIKFTDLSTGHWAYANIVEAANAHDYTKDVAGFETWTLK